MQAYVNNKVAADMQYKGKTFVVEGTVNEIGSAFNRQYVTLQTGELMFSVQCFFSSNAASSLASLQKGQSIRIKGRGNGAMGNVLVENCSVVP